MSRIWFAQQLETVATFWRVIRRDGVTLGFTTHDRDLWLGGVQHRAAPGMVPSAIRRSADLEPDSAEVEGVLSHDALSASDLALGRFDGARVLIGLVDWTSGESETLYRGTIGAISAEADRFNAVLESRKRELQRDPVPRTSPSCRAQFCGPGCALSPVRFSHEAAVVAFDPAANAITLDPALDPAPFEGGTVRWLDGRCAGLGAGLSGRIGAALVLDRPVDAPPPPGTRVLLREGCDRTLATCAARFGNALNFQGEPHLPGNDLITRTPASAA